MAGIRDKHRKTIVGVFTGEEFKIRKIAPTEFMEFFGAIPSEQSDTLVNQLAALGSKLKEAAETPDKAPAAKRFWLEHGVMSPKIFFGAYDECPEDQIHVDDLSDDANRLVSEIAEFSFDFSGFKKKMEELLPQQQPDLAGHGGQEIQQTANGAAPGGDSI